MFPTKIKILVIDDIFSMRQLIKKIIGTIGYENIVEASSGNEALEILQRSIIEQSLIGLIISDWSMPGMSGLELLKKVRSNPDLKDIPFIMITAEVDMQYVKEAIQEGVSSYILKPLNAETLKEKIDQISKGK